MPQLCADVCALHSISHVDSLFPHHERYVLVHSSRCADRRPLSMFWANDVCICVRLAMRACLRDDNVRANEPDAASSHRIQRVTCGQQTRHVLQLSLDLNALNKSFGLIIISPSTFQYVKIKRKKTIDYIFKHLSVVVLRFRWRRALTSSNTKNNNPYERLIALASIECLGLTTTKPTNTKNAHMFARSNPIRTHDRSWVACTDAGEFTNLGLGVKWHHSASNTRKCAWNPNPKFDNGIRKLQVQRIYLAGCTISSWYIRPWQMLRWVHVCRDKSHNRIFIGTALKTRYAWATWPIPCESAQSQTIKTHSGPCLNES